MAYQARLINRHSQMGFVSYDLAVEDDAGILPALRHAVSLPLAQDTAGRRATIRSAAEAAATQDQTRPAKRARLQALRDAAEDARREAIARRDELQERLDKDDV